MKGIVYTLTEQRDRAVDEALVNGLVKDRGHDVHRETFVQNAMKTIPYEKPDFVVLPMLGGEWKVEIARKCHEWGICVIVRRGEAGVTPEVFEKLPEPRQKIILGNWDYKEYVDLELFWGSMFMRLCIDHNKIDPEQARACGPFTLDKYFSGPFGGEKPRRKSNGKRTILWATGFSCGEEQECHPEIGLPKDDKYQDELITLSRKKRKKWIAAMKSFIEETGKTWDHILKVRPGEHTDEYVKAFEAYDGMEHFPKVKVMQQDVPSWEALQECDVVVHTGSTMAVEAYLMGIPSFTMCAMNPDHYLRALSPQISEDPEEIADDLFDKLSNCDLSENNIQWDILTYLENCLYDHIDGLAVSRAVGHIDRYLTRHWTGNEKNVPDVWPLEWQKYKVPGVYKEASGQHPQAWVCPACNGRWWTKAQTKESELRDCCYCGMTVQSLRAIPDVNSDKHSTKQSDRRAEGQSGSAKRHSPDNRGVRAGRTESRTDGDSKKVPGSNRPKDGR